MKYEFLKQIDKTIYFNGYKMEIRVPKYYFDKNMASFIGSKVKTLGLFDFRVIKENGKFEDHILKLPMEVIFEFEDFRNETIEENGESNQYTVFTLEDGMMFLDTTDKEQAAENSKNFVFSLHGGKMPKNIKYQNLIKIYLDNLRLNGTKIANPGCILEMTIAELCRCKDDITIPFRKKAGEYFNSINMLDYKMTNIKNLPPLNSTFTALAFENMDSSIISSINKTVNNKEESISPVEKIIKY